MLNLEHIKMEEVIEIITPREVFGALSFVFLNFAHLGYIQATHKQTGERFIIACEDIQHVKLKPEDGFVPVQPHQPNKEGIEL